MLGGEAEEGSKAEQLALRARRSLRGGLCHRPADAGVQVEHELVEDPLLAVEVEVEGALTDARGLGDLDDRGVVVAVLGEDALGRLDQLLARALAPCGQLASRAGSEELALDDLPQRVPRQLVDEAHLPRNLEPGQPLAAEDE